MIGGRRESRGEYGLNIQQQNSTGNQLWIGAGSGFSMTGGAMSALNMN